MDIWKSIKGEFIDIVAWTFDSHDHVAHRFERHGHEIKMGARLLVREGQAAVFVNEGKVADCFGPGTYTLSTQNLPVLSTLRGWKHLFDSPFKAEVYFLNTVVFANGKWGTSHPVLVRDAELGMVRIRAFGALAWQIAQAEKFFQAWVGTREDIHGEDLHPQIKSLVIGALSDALGEANISAADLASRYTELAQQVQGNLAVKFAEFGLECRQLVIENISLPPEVEALVDKRTGMALMGDTAAYLRFNVADKAGEALAQPGGMAGSLAGAGAGLALGQQLAQGLPAMAAAGAMPSQPPPLPSMSGRVWHISVGGKPQGPLDLAALGQLHAQGQWGKESLVWRTGLPDWVKAEKLTELVDLMAQTPPRLPG